MFPALKIEHKVAKYNAWLFAQAYIPRCPNVKQDVKKAVSNLEVMAAREVAADKQGSVDEVTFIILVRDKMAEMLLKLGILLQDKNNMFHINPNALTDTSDETPSHIQQS